jgi:hypothetical protein
VTLWQRRDGLRVLAADAQKKLCCAATNCTALHALFFRKNQRATGIITICEIKFDPAEASHTRR